MPILPVGDEVAVIFAYFYISIKSIYRFNR